jgi:hypothetical protein
MLRHSRNKARPFVLWPRRPGATVVSFGVAAIDGSMGLWTFFGACDYSRFCAPRGSRQQIA